MNNRQERQGAQAASEARGSVATLRDAQQDSRVMAAPRRYLAAAGCDQKAREDAADGEPSKPRLK